MTPQLPIATLLVIEDGSKTTVDIEWYNSSLFPRPAGSYALYAEELPGSKGGREAILAELRAFAAGLKDLCKDFSDLNDRPYMGDVTSAVDGLLEQTLASDRWQQGQGEPVADAEQWWADTPDGDSALVMRVAACTDPAEVEQLRQKVSDLTVSGHQEYMRCEKMRGQLGEALDENKRLAQLAYVGEHQHEDHTYKARLSELRLQAGGMQMEIDELHALLDEVLNEVPHGWGASFSDSDLAQRIRAQLKQGEDDE